MNWIKFLLVALIVASCTATDTYTAMNEKADFAAYKTFAWIHKDSVSISNTLYDNELIGNEIISKTSNEFISKGFQIELDSPDVLLKYTILIEKKEKIYNTPNYNNSNPSNSGYNNSNANYYNNSSDIPYYSGSYNSNYYSNNYPFNSSSYNFPPPQNTSVSNSVSEVTYKEGTLIIDMIDRRTNQLIWRGWTTETLPEPDKFKKHVQDEIREIMKKYPSESTK